MYKKIVIAMIKTTIQTELRVYIFSISVNFHDRDEYKEYVNFTAYVECFRSTVQTKVEGYVSELTGIVHIKKVSQPTQTNN